jgi:peptide/nickel transport system substrate-binding protein
MTDSYWEKLTKSRITRRRVVYTGSLAGAGALLLSLSGCSDDESGGTVGTASTGSTGAGATSATSEATATPTSENGLVSAPVDTTSSARPGGIYHFYASQDIPGFDGIGGNNGLTFNQSMYAHSRLVKYAAAKYPDRPDGSVTADAASSWEVSADGLQWVFKLRQGLKYDPRPPTNNRVLTSQDVVFSWNRFKELNQHRTDLSHEALADAPVESVSAPDEQTAVFALAFPYAPLPEMLGYYRYLPIMPVESEAGYNVKSEMRGTGAWRLEEFRPGIEVTYSKNPDWYDADMVNLDGIQVHIVPEYATALSQFRAGNLSTYSVTPEDVLQTKKDVPELIMQSTGVFQRAMSPYIAFGALEGSPFLDERVRQAVSMLIDRDLWIDTFYNVSSFETEGLEVESRWNSHVPCSDEAYWLDPHGEALGEGAKYFQYNPDEASRLLEAAGHTLPLATKVNFATGAYGPTYTQQVEVAGGMFEQDGHFKLEYVPHEYTSVWVPEYHEGRNEYEGIVIGAISALPDIDGTLFSNFHPSGIKSWWGPGDAEMERLIEAQRREQNRETRIDLLKEFQRYTATKMFCLISPGQALSFNLAQPSVGNFGVWTVQEAQSDHQETKVHLWYKA